MATTDKDDDGGGGGDDDTGDDNDDDGGGGDDDHDDEDDDGCGGDDDEARGWPPRRRGSVSRFAVRGRRTAIISTIPPAFRSPLQCVPAAKKPLLRHAQLKKQAHAGQSAMAGWGCTEGAGAEDAEEEENNLGA